MNNMWSDSDNRSRMWQHLKLNKDFLKKVLSTEKNGLANALFYKCLNTVSFLIVNCSILVFLGVLTIGIQNSYILHVGYEPRTW